MLAAVLALEVDAPDDEPAEPDAAELPGPVALDADRAVPPAGAPPDPIWLSSIPRSHPSRKQAVAGKAPRRSTRR